MLSWLSALPLYMFVMGLDHCWLSCMEQKASAIAGLPQHCWSAYPTPGRPCWLYGQPPHSPGQGRLWGSQWPSCLVWRTRRQAELAWPARLASRKDRLCWASKPDAVLSVPAGCRMVEISTCFLGSGPDTWWLKDIDIIWYQFLYDINFWFDHASGLRSLKI